MNTAPNVRAAEVEASAEGLVVASNVFGARPGIHQIYRLTAKDRLGRPMILSPVFRKTATRAARS
jgi:hypothetical protein